MINRRSVNLSGNMVDTGYGSGKQLMVQVRLSSERHYLGDTGSRS